MIDPIKTLQPLQGVGLELSSINSNILDLSRIELRRIVQRLQEQVSELQRENQRLKEQLVK